MPAKKSHAQFINDAIAVHGSRYDYTKVEYINSSTKISVLCSKHGEFSVSPNNHLRGSGCPICSNPPKTPALLSLTHLSELWDYNENNIDPINLVAGSNRVAAWKCSKGHKWHERIVDVYARDIGTCHQCNSLSALRPDLVGYWYEKKNGDVKPNMVSLGSNKSFFWKCSVADDHIWQATPYQMSNRKHLCMFCFGRYASSTANLEIDAPLLAAEFDLEANAPKKPSDFTKASKKEVMWRCPNGHSYAARINNRYSGGTSCPQCSNQTSLPEIRLFTEISTLFEKVIWRKKFDKFELDVFLPDFNLGVEYDGYFWHKDSRKSDTKKNNFFKKMGISVIRIRAHHMEKVSDDDIVTSSHELSLDDLKRLVKTLLRVTSDPRQKLRDYLNTQEFVAENEFKRICSYLPSPIPENSFGSKFPDIAEEWDYTENFPLTPFNFSSGSNKKVGWICTNSETHKWIAPIADRGTHGCPFCSGNRITFDNSFAAKFPDQAKTLDRTLSPNVDLGSLAPHSLVEAYWKCDKGHSYKNSLSNRTAYGCNICAGKNVIFETSLEGQKPFMLRYWDFKKNGSMDLHPDKVKAGSNKKAHWICPRGHNFHKKIADMVKSIENKSATDGCNECRKNPHTYGIVANQWKP